MNFYLQWLVPVQSIGNPHSQLVCYCVMERLFEIHYCMDEKQDNAVHIPLQWYLLDSHRQQC